MALDTYSGLQSLIAGFLNRGDLTATIPDFITLAEAQMNRRLRVRKMVERSTAAASTQTFALPTDFLAERTLTIDIDGYARELQFMSPDAMDQLPELPVSPPYYWTVRGTEVQVYPAPDQSYTMTLTYFQRIPALSDSNTSNWLLADYPDAYLYGALLQSAPYLIDDPRSETWGALFVAALTDIQEAGRDTRSTRLRSDAGLRPRTPYGYDINVC